MQHIQFHFKDIQSEEQDQLIALLSQAAVGFEQTDNDLFAYSNDEQTLQELLTSFPLYAYTVQHIEDRNWNQQWETSFAPVTIDAHGMPYVHIRADFHPPYNGAEQEIIITPKMSFGTGHHSTTSLVVKNMKDIDFNYKTVIDFGTGTGVLAILAEKSGAASVLAIDNDEWSINNATENVAVNDCSGIKIVMGEEINCTEPADILIANINLNIILAHLVRMKQCIKPNGILLLSGMLLEDVSAISSALQSLDFTDIVTEDLQNWICVKAIRSAQP